ncbi:MAG: phosphotransferase [Thermoplasmata archaeon]|nr:phosphotransferase [Thermoplasmata archaeon]
MIRILPSRKNLVLDLGDSVLKLYEDPRALEVEIEILGMSGRLPVPRVLGRGRMWVSMEKVGSETLMDALAEGGCPDPGPLLDLIDLFNDVVGLRWGDANPRNFILGPRTYMVDFEEAHEGPAVADAASLLARVKLVNERCFGRYLRAAEDRYGPELRDFIKGELRLISFFRKVK